MVILQHLGDPQAGRMRETPLNDLANYISEISYQRSSLNLVTAGPYRISSSNCDPRDFENNRIILLTRAISAAAQDPVVGDLTRFKNIIILTAAADESGQIICSSPSDGGTRIIDGIHTVSETTIFNGPLNVGVVFYPWNLNLINNIAPIIHEFLHTQSMRHVTTFLCRDNNGNRVPFSQNCQWSGWDRAQTDPLGHRAFSSGVPAYGHVIASAKETANWLSSMQVIITNRGDYTLTPLSSNDNNVKLIKIPRANEGYYSLEFRQPVSYDRDVGSPPGGISLTDPRLEGVFLYTESFFTGIGLLDSPPYPNPNEFERSSIPIGQPVVLPGMYNPITITVNSITPTGASVSIR